MVDDDPTPGRFVLTGSQDLGVHSQVSQSLAGRTAVLTLLPFDLDERAELSPVDDLWQAIWEGGYPAIHDRGIAPPRWLGAYVDTYVERDVRQILAVGDLTTFQAFIELAATHTANLVNLSGLGGGVGVSHNTARSWLSVLEASYVVHRLPPLHRNLEKRIVKAPKLHFVDSGLACWLLGIREPYELRRHPLRGALMETWVVSEVLKAIHSHGPSPRLHHWRDHRGREVDLVVDRGMDLVAVEVKPGATIHSSFFDEEQHRSAGHVLPWRQVQAWSWTGAGR